MLLLELGHRARLAASLPELEFLLVNDTRLLAPYRQAALWRSRRRGRAVGVVQPTATRPMRNGWRAPAHLAGGRHTARAVSAADLPDELGAQWREWLPPRASSAREEPDARPAGGLLLAGADPVAPTPALLTEVEPHLVPCMAALQRAGPGPGTPGATAARVPRGAAPPRPVAACALLAAGAIPVRLSVLAPASWSPRTAVLRAPLDGVVAQIHVQPNQIVKQGQPSVQPGRGPDRQPPAGGATGAEHGRSRIPAVRPDGAGRSALKAQLAALAGKIGERRAEQAFLAEQLGRASVTAPRDGMVLFDSPSEWIGKPVQTGERVMRVADPDAVEIEAWVPVGDAIPLAEARRCGCIWPPTR